MPNIIVTLSSKYQLVIPKAARKRMGLSVAAGQHFKVARVTSNEIVFEKQRTLDSYLGVYGDTFPTNATEALRHQRDNEWDM